MKTNELRTDFWKKSQDNGKPIIHYSEVMDTLFVYFAHEEKEQIITHFVDEYVAFLYRRSDKEIVGMRIEYFKEEFIQKMIANKGWDLRSTGQELDGIRGFRFGVKLVQQPRPKQQPTLPKPIEKTIQLEPVFS